MANRDQAERPNLRPEPPVSVDVKIEIAKQNQELAEFRYSNLVRRGRAWDVRRNDARVEK